MVVPLNDNTIHYALHPQSGTSNARFVKRPDHSDDEMMLWLSQWAPTVLTFGVFIIASSLPSNYRKNFDALYWFLKIHVVRLHLEESDASGNTKWRIGDSMAQRRDIGIPKHSSTYERDMKVDILIDLAFTDKAGNKLGGMLYADYNSVLKENHKGYANTFFRQLEYNTDDLKELFDSQTAPEKIVFCPQHKLIQMTMNNGDTGVYIKGRFVPDDVTKDPYPCTMFTEAGVPILN